MAHNPERLSRLRAAMRERDERALHSWPFKHFMGYGL